MLKNLENAPWERQENEPTMWYDRFVIYLTLGVTRSIRKAYIASLTKNNQDISDIFPPHQWYDISESWQWKDRATAYDDHNRAAIFDNEDKLIRIAREKRINLALLAIEKISQALADKSPEALQKESGNALLQASKQAAQILREDLEGHSTSTRHQIELILRELPPELAQLLAGYVKK